MPANSRWDLIRRLRVNCLRSRLKQRQVFVFYCFKYGTRDQIFFDYSVYCYFTLHLIRHILFTKLSATYFPHSSYIVCKLLQIIPFIQHSTILTPANIVFSMNHNRTEYPYHVTVYDKMTQSSKRPRCLTEPVIPDVRSKDQRESLYIYEHP